MSDVILKPLTTEITTPQEWALSRAVGECLVEHYPGYPWSVRADVKQGIVEVFLLFPFDRSKVRGKGAQPGFRIKLDELANEIGWRSVVWAGGELLERWGQPRGRAPDDAILRAEQHGIITDKA